MGKKYKSLILLLFFYTQVFIWGIKVIEKKIMNILNFVILFALMITVIIAQGQNQLNETGELTDETEYWALLVAVAEYADNPNQNLLLMFCLVNAVFYEHFFVVLQQEEVL